jgi:hypothetical protein
MDKIVDRIGGWIKKKNFKSTGCDGGWPIEALEFAKNSYIAIKRNYPYRGKNKNCRMYGSYVEPLPLRDTLTKIGDYFSGEKTVYEMNKLMRA